MPGSLTMQVGDTANIGGRALVGEITRDEPGGFTFVSSDPGVCLVSLVAGSVCRLRAMAVGGPVTVTVGCKGKSDTITVTVIATTAVTSVKAYVGPAADGSP